PPQYPPSGIGKAGRDGRCKERSQGFDSKENFLHLSTKEQLLEEKTAGSAQWSGPTDPHPDPTKRGTKDRIQRGLRPYLRGCLPPSSPPFEGYEGIPGHPRPHGPAAPKKAANRRSCEGPTADIPGKDEPGKVGRQPVASAGMGEFQRGKVRNCPEGSRFEESNQGIEMEVGP